MAGISYSEQLKHPKWQKRRLEMLEAAQFRCERCGDADTTLHVHHKEYKKGHQVWEYSNDELSVLCENCHADEHDAKDLRNELLAMIGDCGNSNLNGILAGIAYQVTMNNGLLNEWQNKTDPIAVMAGISAWKCSSYLDLTDMERLAEFLAAEVKASQERRDKSMNARGAVFGLN